MLCIVEKNNHWVGTFYSFNEPVTTLHVLLLLIIIPDHLGSSHLPEIDFNSNSFASSLACALIAYHSTNLADTMASELGILAKGVGPILITSGKRVPKGTNGGVTLLGTGCSLLGGCIIGIG